MKRPSHAEWADYHRGRLTPGDEERLERAADSDAVVAATRDQVEQVVTALESEDPFETPQLPWDEIFARVHWERSVAHAAPSSRRRFFRRGLGLAAAAAAGLLVFAAFGAGGDEPVQVAAPEPKDQALRGLIVQSSGEVFLNGLSLSGVLAEAPVVEGYSLRTGLGQISVQLDRGTIFRLGGNSSLEAARLRERDVHLSVRGSIDVQVTKRHQEQRFVVEAGQNRVEVRGTAFRVEFDGELRVSCVHGRVLVTSGNDVSTVSAGQVLWLTGRKAPQLAALQVAELEELEAALTLPLLPAFSQAQWVRQDSRWRHPSASLLVAAELGRAVAVDGVELGFGTQRLRVVAGRHQVAIEQEGGVWGDSVWLNLDEGEQLATAAATAAASPSPGVRPQRAGARLARKRQLSRSLRDGALLRPCLRALEKVGLASGSWIKLEIGVDARGTQTYLNVVDSNVSRGVAKCIRRTVDSVKLPRGPAVELIYRVQF